MHDYYVYVRWETPDGLLNNREIGVQAESWDEAATLALPYIEKDEVIWKIEKDV